jgi:hypothetical protein
MRQMSESDHAEDCVPSDTSERAPTGTVDGALSIGRLERWRPGRGYEGLDRLAGMNRREL